MVYPDASDPLFEYQITWIRALPQLLILLGDKHPSSSEVITCDNWQKILNIDEIVEDNYMCNLKYLSSHVS